MFFILGAYNTAWHELIDICLHIGPPESCVWIRFKVLVTGWPERDACPHCKTSDRTTLGTKRHPGGPLPGPGCGRWAFFTANSIPHWTPAITFELGMMGLVLCYWCVKLSRKGIRLWVLRASSIREDEIETVKKKRAHRARIQPLSLPDVYEVLVVCPNDKWVFGPFKPVSPFLERHLYRQQLPVTYIIVVLAGVLGRACAPRTIWNKPIRA